MRFVCSSPLYRPCRVSTPACVAARFGHEDFRFAIPFRPRGFAPPRRLPPPGGRGLVASRCQSWGSSRFLLPSSRTIRCTRQRCFGGAGAFPATPFTPLEEFPSTAAAPHHCGRCPRAVPSDPSELSPVVPLPVPQLRAQLEGGSTSRRCSAVESVTPPDRCQPLDALSFLGFVPLRGPSSNRGARALDSRVVSAGASEEAPDVRPAPLHHPHTLSRVRALSHRSSQRHFPDEATGFGAVDPIPPRVRYPRSLSGAEVRAARGPLAARLPGRRRARRHRPSWGS